MKKNKILFVFTSCKRSGPIQVMINLIKYLNNDSFETYLITLYDEVEGESQLREFEKIGVRHYKCNISKKDILLGKTKKLKQLITEIKPDLIHSMGVFPDYAISRMKFNNQVITLHNYMYEDYITKFGKIKGQILIFLQLCAIKKARKVWTCSKSLADIYLKNRKIKFDYIRNGIDNDYFKPLNNSNDLLINREKLNIPKENFVYINTGQMIDRKNQEFLLNAFYSIFKENNNVSLVLLGDGKNFQKLRQKYETKNIIFKGNVNNVNEYLCVSNAYISTSKSEGMPNGVLEAMGSKLPVILSNIPQHEEIFDVCKEIGFLYKKDDKKNLEDILNKCYRMNLEEYAKNAFKVARDCFSAKNMSEEYERAYLEVIHNCKETKYEKSSTF